MDTYTKSTCSTDCVSVSGEGNSRKDKNNPHDISSSLKVKQREKHEQCSGF